MQVTRRGFLKGLMVGTATVAVSMGMARQLPSLRERYTWDRVNAGYDYGIDKEHPWDVVVFDNEAGDFIDPNELAQRAEIPAEWDWYISSDDDATDMAYGTLAAIAMSQAAIGLREADSGAPFDGPWKELDDEIDTVAVYTTSQAYYAELEATRAG